MTMLTSPTEPRKSSNMQLETQRRHRDRSQQCHSDVKNSWVAFAFNSKSIKMSSMKKNLAS